MNNPAPPQDEVPSGDPWAAFGYLVAGVAFYGVLGWGLSVWLHASYWIPIGILVGLALGMFMVFSRYRIGGAEAPAPYNPKTSAQTDHQPDPGPRPSAEHDCTEQD